MKDTHCTFDDQHLVPYASYIGFLLTQDIVRYSFAQCVRSYLAEVRVATTVWPARSPDLNPLYL